MMTESEIARVPPGGWYYRANANLVDGGRSILTNGDKYVFLTYAEVDSLLRMTCASHNACVIKELMSRRTTSTSQFVLQDKEHGYWLSLFKQAQAEWVLHNMKTTSPTTGSVQLVSCDIC